MCDQTELLYSPGDIVWVKLGPVWWPGQVQDYDKLPEEITSNFKKKPIAVVKFFQEESFEYVKNINHVYHYNCRKKHEFIKKGLDMCRSANTRDVPSNMHLFPNDIATAEHLTGGNPNIIKDDEFAPEEKPDYSELFGTKKTPGKKLKSDSIKKEYSGWRLKHLKESSLKNGRRSLPATSPRAITHPRFINKAFHGQSDHEVRIRHQITTPLREDDPVLSSPQKQYNCHICGFTSARLNVIVLHNKSHSAGFADTYLATSANQLKRPKLKDYSVSTAFVKSRVKSTPRRLLLGLETPKRKKERSPKEPKAETSDAGPVTSTPKKERVVEDKTPVKKPEFGKRKSAKDKKQNAVKQKLENEAIRETLLKDWDEDDEMQEEAEIKQVKHIKEDKPNEDREEKDGDRAEKVKAGGKSRLLGKRSLRLGKSLGNKEDPSKGKETSCFDFDDSDEGIRLDKTVMKFGMKIPRVLSDDKTKRKSLDVETAEQVGTLKEEVKNLEEEFKKVEEDAKLETAFESLLEETAVPVIPDIPKNLPAINTLDCTKSVSADVQGIRESSNDGTDINADAETVSVPDMQEVIPPTRRQSEPIDNAETIETNPICNITEIASINAKDFESAEDVNEFVKKTDSVCCEPITEDPSTEIRNMCVESTMDFESSIESSLIKKQLPEFEMMSSEFKIDETMCTPTKMESTEVVQQNKSQDRVEISVPGNIEPISNRPTNECEENVIKVESEIVREQHENITMEHEQKLDELNSVQDMFAVPSMLETHEDDRDLEHLNTDTKQHITKLQTNVEAENIQNISPTKTKLDFQHIVDDIYMEETISASPQNIVNESNVEMTSDHTLLPQLIETKTAPRPKEVKLESVEPVSQNINVTDTTKFQDMPFDINSMPVIIGEDLIQSEDTKTQLILSPNKVASSETLVTQSQNKNVIMISNQGTSGNEQVVGGSKAVKSVISVAGRDGQIITGKTLGQKPLTTVKTIKIPPGTPLNKLKSVPGFSKSGSSNQVLILKTTGGQTSKVAVNKSNLQKLGTQQIIQQSGGKVLILTNPQTSGQGKIATITPQQQVLTSSSKLPFGTRLITSKGTVLTTSGAQTLTLSKSTVQKAGQKYVISKGNILSTTSKNMMIGKSGILTPITSTTTKGQTFITQNVGASKSSLIIPSSSSVSKSQAIVTQALGTSKGMILTPMTSKGIISGNQKVRIVSSTAPVNLPSGARIVVQNPQSKILTIPQQKNQKLKIVSNTKVQQSGGTLLIQTSQGHPTILTSTVSSSQITKKPMLIPVSKSLPSITPQIVPRQTVPQTQPQILKKTVQKVRQASPNILQKSQKKPTPRGQKSYSNRLITPQTISSPAQETILLSPTGLPVVEQSNIIKAGLPQGDGTALVYLTVDESGNCRQLTDNSLLSFEGTQQDSRTLYIDPGTTDMDNIFLTIDDAGNVLNITQPAPPTFTSESSIPSQDILAKALANTQVLQQETLLSDTVTSSIISPSLDHLSAGLNSSFTEQSQYPPSLAHSVLETSLTLNQPIMTPLEVPSAVTSSNLSQIASLPPSFIHSNILTHSKTQLIRPSMPLLTEDTDSPQRSEPVYLLDSANNIIAPVTSGSQLSLQLALNDNVIVSQGGAYQVMTTNVLTSPVFTDQNTNFKNESNASGLNGTNSVQTPFILQADQNEITISAEFNQGNESESPHLTTNFLNEVELKHNEIDTKAETLHESMMVSGENADQYLNDEPSRKRSVEGVCDTNIAADSSPKRVKIEER